MAYTALDSGKCTDDWGLSLLVIINICLHLSVNNFLTLSISGKCCLQVYESTFIIIRFSNWVILPIIKVLHGIVVSLSSNLFSWKQFAWVLAVCGLVLGNILQLNIHYSSSFHIIVPSKLFQKKWIIVNRLLAQITNAEKMKFNFHFKRHK